MHISKDGRVYQLDSFWKMQAIYERLRKIYPIEVIDSDRVDSKLLLNFHTAEFVDSLLTGQGREKYIESCGVFWQPWLPVVMTNRAKATVQSIRNLIEGDTASILLSDGGHHTTPSQAFGFGPINSLGIALYELRKELSNKKIVILDLDTHRSNGFSFIELPNLRLYDLWNQALPKWPINIESNNYYSYEVHDSDSYQSSLNDVLEEIRQYSPQIIVYYSGTDVLETDRMHGIPGFSEKLFRAREDKVIRFANEIGSKLLLAIGGGYVNYNDVDTISASKQALVENHLYTVLNVANRFSS